MRMLAFESNTCTPRSKAIQFDQGCVRTHLLDQLIESLRVLREVLLNRFDRRVLVVSEFFEEQLPVTRVAGLTLLVPYRALERRLGDVQPEPAVAFKLRLRKPLICGRLMWKIRMRDMVLQDVLWFISHQGRFEVYEISQADLIRVLNRPYYTVT